MKLDYFTTEATLAVTNKRNNIVYEYKYPKYKNRIRMIL